MGNRVLNSKLGSYSMAGIDSSYFPKFKHFSSEHFKRKKLRIYQVGKREPSPCICWLDVLMLLYWGFFDMSSLCRLHSGPATINTNLAVLLMVLEQGDIR